MFEEIILASKSLVRKKILEENGIKCIIEPSNIDEDLIKESLLKENANPKLISKNLAELKANKVSQKKNGNLVLGADSIINLKEKIISKVSKNGSALDVEWSDGEKSNFNFMWLRDNCPTAHDKDSRHRMFNILEISTNIEPKTCKINNEGKLEIEWSEGNHTSYYDQEWLRKNCYTINNKKEYVSPYQLWDRSLQENLKSISIEHDEIISSD